MAGKFEIFKDSAGEFRFRLKAANGEIIATSEGYTSKGGCENGIESVKKNATDDARYEVFEDKAGETRFNLKAANGEVIAVSEGYKAKAGCDNGINSVKTNAPDAEVVDLT